MQRKQSLLVTRTGASGVRCRNKRPQLQRHEQQALSVGPGVPASGASSLLQPDGAMASHGNTLEKISDNLLLGY